MLVNYHFHDRNSGDAIGLLEENIQVAIKNDIKYFGIANHAEGDLKSIIPLIRQPKSILYFSNVGNYYANWHKRSLSELDTIFNTIFSCAHDTSFFIGWYPANKFIAENVKIQKQPAEEFPWRD